MNRLAITLAVSTTLGLAAAAGAALPVNGAFAGKTSLRPINGFSDIITFTSAKNGAVLKKFVFGTLGCFGTSAYPVGVDPYGEFPRTPQRSAALDPGDHEGGPSCSRRSRRSPTRRESSRPP